MTQLTIRQFLKHRMAVIGFVVMLVITILVAGASIFQRYDPLQINLRNRFQPPSLEHFFGTDDLGRDMWARTLKGGQVSLMVGFLAMGVSIILGSVIGLVSGYFGGWTDSILSRITEIFQSVPRLFILIALTTFLRAMDIPWLRPGTFWPIAMVIGILAWMGVARLVRGSTLELREQEFIQAARMIGASNARILVLHILPNVLSPIIVSATLGLAGAIITESGLSYLGFGIQLPTPTWGNMLSGTQNQMTTAPWTAIFPGLMIFIVVIAINYMGDGLRDALDPYHVERD
ncbi:MAG: ABC transporter permease [Anaerolineaceae bacterium]|nr:ABC transporter permease [Anaerolineaceae bacterium]